MRTIEERLDKIEKSIDYLIAHLVSGGATPPQTEQTSFTKLLQLTTKQHMVMQGLMLGMSNKAIGDMIGLAANTVKVHVKAICRKFDIHSRTHVVATLHEEYNACDPATYLAIAGVAKDWAKEKENE